MAGNNTLTFTVAPYEDGVDTLALTPLIDGVSLVDLVRSFEQRRGYDPRAGTQASSRRTSGSAT
jgi:hypothetical protein